MKKIIVLLAMIAVVLAACAPEKSEPTNPLALWPETARLEAEETPEELYASALKEDVLIVYSTSTRMMDAAKTFEAQYPGLIVRVKHMRERELYDKLFQDYEAGNYVCDVITSADGRGIMVNEFLPKNIAVKYVPYDIKDKMLPGNNEELLMIAGEAVVVSYNEKYYKEPPVNNWWELTEEKWRGMVYIPNPARSVTTHALFCVLVAESEMMAKAYETLYGQKLKLKPGENAGHEFIRRLVKNDAVIVNSSDEAAEKVGEPGSASPALGIMISSKTRLRDIGYEMVNHYKMEPFCGVYEPINIMLAGGARNINTAKLYIRWLLGETDGTGAGYKPYLQNGAWTVRNDVNDNTGVRTDKLNLLYLNRKHLYSNYDSVFSFWENLIKKRE